MLGRSLVVGSFVGLTAVGTFANDAAAQGNPHIQPAGAPDAKAHYQAGVSKHGAGDFAGALVEFQAADAIKSTAQAQRYIGVCQDNLGHYPEAIAAYEKFLTNVPAKQQAQGEELKKRVAMIKAMPGRVHVETTPAKASMSVDGKPGASTPADLDLAPGKHTLHFEFASYAPADKEVDVTFASHQDLKLELVANPSATPTVPPVVAAVRPPTPSTTDAPGAKTRSHTFVPMIVTGSLAVVAAGVGGVFGILALLDKGDFNSNPNLAAADSGETKTLVADIAFGAAFTLGVTTLALFLLKDDSATNEKTAEHRARPFALSPSPRGAMIRF